MSFRQNLLILVLLLATLPASAQTRFFAPGQDGHSAIVQSGISSADINLAGAYSHVWDGRFELGLFVGHSWMDDPDAQGWFYGPALGIGLMKPEKRFPIGLEFQGQFQISDVQANTLSDARVGYEGQVFQGDAILYGEIAASPALTLYPTGVVSYLNGSVEFNGGYFLGPAATDVDEVAFSLGLSMVARNAIQFNLLATTMDGDWSAVASVGLLKMGPVDGHRPHGRDTLEETLDETLPY